MVEEEPRVSEDGGRRSDDPFVAQLELYLNYKSGNGSSCSRPGELFYCLTGLGCFSDGEGRWRNDD